MCPALSQIISKLLYLFRKIYLSIGPSVKCTQHKPSTGRNRDRDSEVGLNHHPDNVPALCVGVGV